MITSCTLVEIGALGLTALVLGGALACIEDVWRRNW